MRPTGLHTYAQELDLLKGRSQWISFLAFIGVAVLVPRFVSDRVLTILTMIGISVISAHGLNLLTGLCGQVSLGHVAFMAVGGYVCGILTAKVGLSFWVAFPLGALAAGLVGLIFGLPSLRIKGFYLIMSTIAAYFIIIWFILQLYHITGGPDGLAVPRPKIGGFELSSKVSYFYLVLAVAVVATLFAHNISRSRIGRAFIAIRDFDIAAEAMGVNLWFYKLQAFFIGCVYAGAAGALLVHYYSFASVDQFPFIDSVWYLAMLIVGGIGNTWGAVVGAAVLKLLDELVTIIGPILAGMFPAVAAQFAAALSLIVRGVVIVLFLIFEPRGLYHGIESLTFYIKRWPLRGEERTI